MAQNKYSLGPQRCACAAVAACSLHEVVLLGDRGEFGPTDDSAMHLAKKFVDPSLSMLVSVSCFGAEDRFTCLGIKLME